MSDSTVPVDTTVVGAGPAGVSAALWCRTFDLRFRWLDRTGEIGGMLERVANPLQNYVGRGFEDGSALARRLRRQIDVGGLDPPEPRELERAKLGDEPPWALQLADGSAFESETLVLATGTSYRRLDIPGESEGMGEYVSQSTSRDAERFAGRTVAMVGGGDAGFEGALQLADHGCRVHMLLRSEQFRARPAFVEPAQERASISIHPIPTTVRRIRGLPERDGCILEVETRSELRSLEVACLFVRIGVDPVYPEFQPVPETDDEGFLRVDRRQRTSVPALFAAGDVTDTPLPAVATSVGSGAMAAHSAGDRLSLV